MKILVIEPSRNPYVKEINGELEEMQEIVGGLIQEIPIDTYSYTSKDMVQVGLICNEEYRFLGFPINRYITELKTSIRGIFFICGLDGEEFCSLAEELIEWFIRHYSL